ncbi:MAG: FAD-dependent oxidoreductase [Parasporobacterium sp.]|nr:FAD-dependent oxidoreductase [Parasporobacterium sp.]
MKQISADIAIIGAGPAGLAAAITAGEHGLEAVVFEKSAVAGGTANMGMGPFGVESRIQKERMVPITKEEAFKMFMDYVHWQADAHLIHDYFWKSGETIDWLEDMGVEFAEPAKWYPTSMQTWHVVLPEGGGKPGPRAASAMTKVMYERAQELGVQFYMSTPAIKLIREDDYVCGLIARSEDEEYEVTADAVIIATGGFGDNPEMIKQYIGLTYGKDISHTRVPGLDGDGIKMAWEVGAGKSRMDMESGLSSLISGPKSGFTGLHVFRQPSCLLVNSESMRVMDESILENGAISKNVAMLQKGHTLYNILCDSIVEDYRRNGVDYPSGVFRFNPAEGFHEAFLKAQEMYPESLFMAESIEELAELMGLDPQQLRKTVDEYNTSCDNHFDDLYCKERRYLRPVQGRIFYGLKMILGGYGSLGGIKINYKFEVITEDHEVIQGLYAIGTDACDIYAGTYLYHLPGNTMGFAINGGRLAVEHILEYFAELEAAGEEKEQ